MAEREEREGVRRLVLVPHARSGDAARGGLRRFSLARLAPSGQSALGADRHERLEQVAEEESRSDEPRA